MGREYASTVVGARSARSAVGLKSVSTVVGAVSARSVVGHQYVCMVVGALSASTVQVESSLSDPNKYLGHISSRAPWADDPPGSVETPPRGDRHAHLRPVHRAHRRPRRHPPLHLRLCPPRQVLRPARRAGPVAHQGSGSRRLGPVAAFVTGQPVGDVRRVRQPRENRSLVRLEPVLAPDRVVLLPPMRAREETDAEAARRNADTEGTQATDGDDPGRRGHRDGVRGAHAGALRARGGMEGGPRGCRGCRHSCARRRGVNIHRWRWRGKSDETAARQGWREGRRQGRGRRAVRTVAGQRRPRPGAGIPRHDRQRRDHGGHPTPARAGGTRG